MNEHLTQAAANVLDLAKREGLTIVTAESCTAGLLSLVLSDAPGAAEHLHGGFVTYTKEQKHTVLGVSWQLLREKGAVCREVACAMAEGALANSTADVAIAITGVAGPEPDEDGNPVGRTCFALARRGAQTQTTERNYGDIGRDAVRESVVRDVLAALVDYAATTSKKECRRAR
jgi:nicotinamide-nucleotide amidase